MDASRHSLKSKESENDPFTTPEEFGSLNASGLTGALKNFTISKSGGITPIAEVNGGIHEIRGNEDMLSPLKSHLSESYLDTANYTKYEIISSRHPSYDRYQDFLPQIPISPHSLNLNIRQQRLIVLTMILFLWCFPTISLSLDFYFNDDDQQQSISNYSVTDNTIHLVAMTVILVAILCLLFFEMVRVRHWTLRHFCGFLLITGGCIHLVGTVLFAKSRCSDQQTKFSVIDDSAYCLNGYIGANSLGFSVPFVVGIDVWCSFMGHKTIRCIVFAVILWITALTMIIALCRYGNGFGPNIIDHSASMSHGLFCLITLGWWLLFWATSFVILEIVVAIYVLKVSKFQFEFVKYRVLNMLLGFALIVSVSFILVQKDGCVAGKAKSGDLFCQYRKTYMLTGLTCLLGYEMQTLT